MPTDPSIITNGLRPQPAMANPVEQVLTLRNLAAQQQNQQIQAQQGQELRGQQLEKGRMEIAASQREQSEVEAMSAALKESVEPDPVTGMAHPNYEKASAKLYEQGFVTAAQHLEEAAKKTVDARTAYRKQLTAFQAAGKEQLGELAHDSLQLIKSGQPLNVIKTGIIGRVALAAGEGLISEDQAHQFIAQAGAASPEALTTIFEQFLTPGIREREGKITKQAADLAKTEAETTKVKGEVAGTLPETAAQASTRHLAEARLRLAQNADARAAKAADAKVTGVKPSTGVEKGYLTFFNRARQADVDLEGMEEKIQQQGLASQAYRNNAPNFMQTDLGQRYTQAQRAFTEARLRKDSGAAIPPEEFENDRKTYFAATGDNKETLEQKRRGRAAVLASLSFGAGNALGEFLGDHDEAKTMVKDYQTRSAKKADEKAADAAGGFAVGQVVKVGNKRVKITALHPDGTFDGDDVK